MTTIVTITGVTCSGKSTLESKLCKLPGYRKVVSFTTRQPRDGEVDGVDYHFITKAQLQEYSDLGYIVESVVFGEVTYGILDSDIVIYDGEISVIVCEPNGVNQINAYCNRFGWTHIAVFVTVDPHVQASRFILRDVIDTISQRKPNQAIINRLALMLGVESTWKNDFAYNAIVEFNKDTEESVLNYISNLVLPSTSG